MEDSGHSYNSAIEKAQTFLQNCLSKLFAGDREALLGAYIPDSTISWKGTMITPEQAVLAYQTLRSRKTELSAIDAQPIPDDSQGRWKNQVLVVATVIMTPELPDDPELLAPTIASHTFILSPLPGAPLGSNQHCITHHVFR